MWRPTMDEEQAILALLDARAEGKTACPSEVARALAGAGRSWRGLMPAVREAADRLAQRGAIVVTQRGVGVSALQARGPIRLAKAPVQPAW